MKSPLSLEGLEVLDAIERKGSFAAAAGVLNKVPSAVSYTVQKLEQDLGVTLFQKQGRRAVLTPAGQLLVERGRLLLEGADQLADATRQLATGWEPRLRVAVDASVSIEWLLPVFEELYGQQPAIELRLTTEVLAGTWEALVENRVDLIVGAVGGVPGHKGIHCEPWLPIEHVFVASPGHPVCKRPQPLTGEEISRHRSVVVSDTSRNSVSLSRGFVNRESALYVPTMKEKIAAHRLGLGVGYVPRHEVEALLASGELLALTVAPPREVEVSMLAWKAGNRGQALHCLVKRLRNYTLETDKRI